MNRLSRTLLAGALLAALPVAAFAQAKTT